MKTADGFDQCYNGQAAVTDDMFVVGAYANAHCNDKEELNDVLDQIDQQALGKVEQVVADTGYFSEAIIKGTQQREVDAYISVARQAHNQWLDDKLSNTGPPQINNRSQPGRR